MAEAQIITNRYVQIEHTPAGIGERIFARMLDYLIMAVYLRGLFYLIDYFDLGFNDSARHTAGLFALFMPVVFYSLMWEIINRGRSPGKMIFGMRVVMRDGTTPTIGAYFMRWLLLMIDTWGWMGVIVILLNRDNRRLGDLAAGTIVIKEKNYHRIHVSLDEFSYLSRDYRPVFPQAENLSLEQVNTISETLMRRDANHPQRIASLSGRVKEFLRIYPEMNDEMFLRTLVRDYQYYAMEEI
ncbi:MAG: RDD family protein [Tannerella sp.]|jgi:uncharacterized RDD family membrane protein YckC|nr:RDD family protein [Tannerella sp.]